MAAEISGDILRLIDANANRYREALRVVEDYARFVLESKELSGELKNLRHELSEAVRPWLGEAIIHRDTPGDVGTTIKTSGEQTRSGLADVVIAAGKRAGEAMRAIEEFLKIADVAAAARVESLRYRHYEIERRIALTLRPDQNLQSRRLYVLITESACKHPWLKTAELAIEGGADWVQLREKNLADGELLSRARQLSELCRGHGVLCIINDRPDIAVASGADGVHLGQEDMPISDARRIVGSRKIIGLSTHKIEQARRAKVDGADYIGVGPIFKSATKPRDFVAGLEYAAAVRSLALPKVAIAGIGLENVDQVLATGILAVAVTAAITGCEDVAGAAREFKNRLMRK
ncbi:MAG TPA: thiamine phosphate synthase [Tepidisphaeraceae bacterium]